MINQFRCQYPQGSIISELVSTKHGKYIVKVTLESEGKILATALAGAETVELAEDRARERAFALVDFPLPKSEATVKVSPPSPPPPNSPVETNPTPPISPVETTPKETFIPSGGDFVADIIAEINLQMERLAWTRDQGKDYLLKTYGKKSRHLLSDQELIEFLNYLKNQVSRDP